MRIIGVVGLLWGIPLVAGSGQEPGHPANPGAMRRDSARPDRMQRQMPGMAMMGPLGIPMNRSGSGTSWLPDSSPEYMLHRTAGSWQFMLHGNGYLQYIREGGDRGADQFGSVNWAMGMARGPLAGGDLAFRTMLSAEPLTVGECGYPDLLATGESCNNGQLLHDRQHPHDLFMELAASYDRELTRSLAFQLYGGPVGEPALGPSAYPHRVSSLANPIAPVSHHWLDATHITFGVMTAGVYGRRWKLEGSLFNGREPDENRYDFDFGALDSYSGRLWIIPTPRLALQASAGRLTEVEPGQNGGPRTDQTRLTASATHQGSWGTGLRLATTVAWGQNREEDHTTNALLAESMLDLSDRDLFFARLEWAQKTGADLVLEEEGAPELAEEIFEVGSAGFGYLRQIARVGGLSLGAGARVGLNLVPTSLEPFYGSRTPVGFAVFVNLRPGRMMPREGMAR